MSLTTPMTRTPTQVAPNHKCNGCEHLSPQLGTTGMCEVGSFPQNCGDGSDTAHGYKPFAGGMVEVNMTAAISSPGSEVPTDNFTIPMQIIELSKSIARDVKMHSNCELHRSGHSDSGMSLSLHVPVVVTMCKCVKGRELAQEIRKSLPTRFHGLSDTRVLDMIAK